MTDYRKLLISRHVEPLLETMASILVSETSATGETSIEGIRNSGEEGRTVHKQVYMRACTHTHTHTQAVPETAPHDTATSGLLITSLSNSC